MESCIAVTEPFRNISFWRRTFMLEADPKGSAQLSIVADGVFPVQVGDSFTDSLSEVKNGFQIW